MRPKKTWHLPCLPPQELLRIGRTTLFGAHIVGACIRSTAKQGLSEGISTIPYSVGDGDLYMPKEGNGRPTGETPIEVEISRR